MNILKRLRLAWNIFRADLDLVEDRLKKTERKYTAPVANTKEKYEIIGEQNKKLYKCKRSICEVMEELGMGVDYDYKRLDSPSFDSNALPRRACGMLHTLPCGLDSDCKITKMNHGMLPVSKRILYKHRKNVKEIITDETRIKQQRNNLKQLEEDLKELQDFIELEEDNELY